MNPNHGINPGSRIQNPVSRIENPRSRNQHPEYGKIGLSIFSMAFIHVDWFSTVFAVSHVFSMKLFISEFSCFSKKYLPINRKQNKNIDA